MTGTTDTVFAMRPICNIYNTCYNKGEIMPKYKLTVTENDSELVYRVGRIEYRVGNSDTPSFRIIDGPEDKQTRFDSEMFIALKIFVGLSRYIDEVVTISNIELASKGLNELSKPEEYSIRNVLRQWEIYKLLKFYFYHSDYVEDIIKLINRDLEAVHFSPLTDKEHTNASITLFEGGKRTREPASPMLRKAYIQKLHDIHDFKVVCDERPNQQEGSESMEYDDFNYYSAPKRTLSISDEGIFSFTFPATADQHERTMVFRPRNGMAVEDLIKHLDRELPYTYNEEPLSELEKDKIRGQCGNSR